MGEITFWAAAAALAAALLAARRFRWLTAGGMAAAVAVGALILAGAGWGGLLLLLLFFVTASALTSWNPSRAGALRAGGDAAGRSASQVLANGGVAAACALLAVIGGSPVALHAMAGALAAAAADTWATEVGTGVGGPTRRILTWEPVAPGRSGGLSWAGTLAGVGGALVVGAAAALLPPGTAATGAGGAAASGAVPAAAGAWLVAGLVGGIVGMTADSVLGASLEERVEWIDNDAVNLFGTLAGAIAAGVAAWLAGAGL